MPAVEGAAGAWCPTRRPASGLPGARRPASGLPGARRPASGLPGVLRPASGLPGARRPASGLPGVLRDDEGAATVVGAFAAIAIVVVTVMVMYTGVAVSARHQAQSAADLAALAGAGALVSGIDEACSAAKSSATRMHAALDDCTVDGWDVQVQVHVRAELARFGVRDAVALARAGPAT